MSHCCLSPKPPSLSFIGTRALNSLRYNDTRGWRRHVLSQLLLLTCRYCPSNSLPLGTVFLSDFVLPEFLFPFLHVFKWSCWFTASKGKVLLVIVYQEVDTLALLQICCFGRHMSDTCDIIGHPYPNVKTVYTTIYFKSSSALIKVS